jgi:CRP-like cAMP-binding protein
MVVLSESGARNGGESRESDDGRDAHGSLSEVTERQRATRTGILVDVAPTRRDQSHIVVDPSELRSLPPFAGVSDAACRELAARAARRVYDVGETLFVAGAEARGLYVVVRGRVRVVKHATGRRHVLHEEGPGGTLGEVPLFEGGGYPATAIAAEPTTCVVIGRAALGAAMRADPEVAWRFLARLAGRVRTLVERVDGLAARSVPQRLAALLVARHEGAAGAGTVVTLGGTQQEVAEELGTVREVVVRAVRALCEAGAIEPAGRGRYRVRDAARLKELAR